MFSPLLLDWMVHVAKNNMIGLKKKKLHPKTQVALMQVYWLVLYFPMSN